MKGFELRRTEEILETVFTQREVGRDDGAGIVAQAAGEHAPDVTAEDLRWLERQELIRLDDGRVTLTPEGESRARSVVRRHRLTERLFRDLLQLSDSQTESQACELEHILSPEATDSVCTLLGHPPTCPHGKPIPPGECCAASQKALRPFVTGLPAFDLGVAGTIAFIAPKVHDRMDRLASLGILPGSPIRLRQRSPSYVIEVGETTIALDPEIARDIFVKRSE